MKSKTNEIPELEQFKNLIMEACKRHNSRSIKEAIDLVNIRDYFLWLTVDALEDEKIAKELVDKLEALETWLSSIQFDFVDDEVRYFYIGIIFCLNQLLSLKYEIKQHEAEVIDREGFEKSWKETKKGLFCEEMII